MTQQRTVIQSGNNSLRAYEVDGILTPAKGLDEYVQLIFNSKAINPFPFPIEFLTAVLDINGLPSQGDMYSIKIDNWVYYRNTFNPDLASNFSEVLPALIVLPNQEIEFVSFQQNFSRVRLIAKKCAFIQTVDTSVDS